MVKKPKIYFSAAFFGIASMAPGSASADILNDAVQWGASAETVKAHLEDNCATGAMHKVEPPKFPLAKKTETHLVCTDYSASGMEISNIAFVFGDDQLKLIEARGGAARALTPATEDEPRTYLHYQVFDEGERFVDQENDAVWLLSKEALHPNLFTWSNPFLSEQSTSNTVYNASAAIPAILDFDADYDAALPVFEDQCPIMNVEPQENPWLPNQPEKQVQINCFGYEYAGFPRKIEAVYGDGKLEVVWILTGAQEEARIRQALTGAFGDPVSVQDDWEVFSGERVVLRKDKPEVLMISEEMIPFFRQQFGGGEN